MTAIHPEHPVKRETSVQVKARPVILKLYPGYAQVKLKGLRHELPISYEAIYNAACKAEAMRIQAEKARAKQTRRIANSVNDTPPATSHKVAKGPRREKTPEQETEREQMQTFVMCYPSGFSKFADFDAACDSAQHQSLVGPEYKAWVEENGVEVVRYVKGKEVAAL